MTPQLRPTGPKLVTDAMLLAEELRLERERLEAEQRRREWLALAVAIGWGVLVIGGLVAVAAVIR